MLLEKATEELNHWGGMTHQPMFLMRKNRTIKPIHEDGAVTFRLVERIES